MKLNVKSNTIISVAFIISGVFFYACKKQILSHEIKGTVLHAYTHEPINNATIIVTENRITHSVYQPLDDKEKNRLDVNERGEFTFNTKGYYTKDKDVFYTIGIIDKNTSVGYFFPPGGVTTLNVKKKKDAENQTFYVNPLTRINFVIDSTIAISKDIKTLTIITKYETQEFKKVNATCGGGCGVYWYYISGGQETFIDPGQNDITYRYITNTGIVSPDYHINQLVVAGYKQIELTF